MISRGVWRHPRFDEKLDELSETYPRLREAVEGLLWTLAREPDSGVYVAQLGVYRARFSVPPDGTHFFCFYSVNQRLLHALLLNPVVV